MAKSNARSWLACALPLSATLQLGGCERLDNFLDELHGHDDPTDGDPTDSEIIEPIVAARAIVPALTFSEGATSGRQLGPKVITGVPLPLVNKVPVQGFSAALPGKGHALLVMSDNGFDALENSAHYPLRVYTLEPDFHRRAGGSGMVQIVEFFTLRDPDHWIDFPIVHHYSSQRELTGADFDIESMQRAADGTLWFGDEFGPFLLHTDESGRLLEAPIAAIDPTGAPIRSPQNPYNEESSALRVMNAVAQHARDHGAHTTPIVSPHHALLVDKNPATGHHARDDQPHPGLAAASSEIFDISSLQQARFPVVVWTVNDPARIKEVIELGVDGVISDRPDLLWEVASRFDGNGDGQPDFLDHDGLIDRTRFDAQGHRGARDLRPENTLPAMEAALDALMPTLESDIGITLDRVALLSHDPFLAREKCRRSDGSSHAGADHGLINELTLTEVQSQYICDKLGRGVSQRNDLALSPVSVAYAQRANLAHVYAVPSLEQLFHFVDFYSEYYRAGAGKGHQLASKRAKNAGRVHFNLETKINPRHDRDPSGRSYAERTVDVATFVHTLAETVAAFGLEDRASIQSFDFRTLLMAAHHYPDIRTVFLFGDFPIYQHLASADGSNLQDEHGVNTPWLAGLKWPYRITQATHPFKARTSGGFEGMAIDPSGRYLYPMLQKPLVGAGSRELLIQEFDTRDRRYTTRSWSYPLDRRGTAIGDFQLVTPNVGLVIERDDSQGRLDGFKSLFRIELPAQGERVAKIEVVDLLDIADPDRLGVGRSDDVGVNGDRYAMPFAAIDSLLQVGPDRLLVINDNKFPFSVGRHIGSQAADDSELVLLDLPTGTLPRDLTKDRTWGHTP